MENLTSLQAQEDEQRQLSMDLSEQLAVITKAETEHRAALGEAQQEFLTLTQERYGAQTRAVEQAQHISELQNEIDVLREQQSQDAIRGEELNELGSQIAALTAERNLRAQKEEELRTET